LQLAHSVASKHDEVRSLVAGGQVAVTPKTTLEESKLPCAFAFHSCPILSRSLDNRALDAV
jgi:hypothetical protein